MVSTIFGVKVYISPSKALVQEKLRDWNQKFNSWGISCLELTGDNETYNTKNIQEADIILTTPEVIYQFFFGLYLLFGTLLLLLAGTQSNIWHFILYLHKVRPCVSSSADVVFNFFTAEI